MNFFNMNKIIRLLFAKKNEQNKQKKNQHQSRKSTMSLFRIEKLINKLIVDKLDMDYFDQAGSWYEDVCVAKDSALRRARWLNIFLLVLLGLSIIAIAVMMPLKKTTDRVFTVDKSTGVFGEIKSLNAKDFTPSWQTTRYFIGSYVTNRESYHRRDINRPYQKVVAMSDRRVGHVYMSGMTQDNPKSPLNTLNNKKYIDVKLHPTIERLNAHTVEVHFTTELRDASDGSLIKEKHWDLILKWKYTFESQTQQQRDFNPLGFKVTYYYKSQIL